MVLMCSSLAASPSYVHSFRDFAHLPRVPSVKNVVHSFLTSGIDKVMVAIIAIYLFRLHTYKLVVRLEHSTTSLRSKDFKLNWTI